MPAATLARLTLYHLAWYLLSLVAAYRCIRTTRRSLISQMSITSEQAPRSKSALRAQPPKHIPLPSPTSEPTYQQSVLPPEPRNAPYSYASCPPNSALSPNTHPSTDVTRTDEFRTRLRRYTA
ncbi:hypothetical protein RSAG8_04522, partial [Rhizoctonia solani AG-8 WAC10335]